LSRRASSPIPAQVTDLPAIPNNPFRVPAFNLFWVCRITAVLASQIQATAIGWQVYNAALKLNHGDVKVAAFSLGLVGLAQFLPMVILTLPAGEIADRRDRKLIVALCLAADAVCAGFLVVMAFQHEVRLWPFFVVAVAFGASRAFIAPASGAVLPMLTPREILPRAIVLNSVAFQCGTIAGPALGGVLFVLGARYAYGAALALFLIGMGTALLIRVNTKPVAQPGSRWALIREGLGYVWRTKVVFGAISLDLVAVLLGGATALMPAFAANVLHVGPQGFGLLRAAPAVGAVVMALYLSIVQIHRRGGMWMFIAVAVFGVATIVFGLSKIFWVTIVALIVLGAADMVSVNVRQTLIQIVTPDHMRGRVSAVSMLFISASNELGEFETGVVARFLGPIGAAVAGGVGSLMATGLWAWWFPALRKADRLT
jgi:MFS family permease